MPQRYVALEWAMQLEKSSILSLLYMPHFGCGTEINTCVNQLLLLFHNGVLCLGKPIPMNVDLINSIIGLPATEMDPTLLLKNDQEAAIAK